MSITTKLTSEIVSSLSFPLVYGLSRSSLPSVLNSTIVQALLISQAPQLIGKIADERTGLGDDRPKQPGRAYNFDGVTARIQSNIDLTGTDALTGFVRFNLTGLTPLDYLMDQSVTATGFGFRITDLGQLQFFRYTSGFPVMVATSAGTVNIVSVGQDHSAAFVFSSTSVKFYLDGALIHTVTTPSNALAVSGGSTHIGGQVSGSVGTLHGKLYEAHAFKNRALSDEDILALHNHTYEGEIGEIFYTCEDNHPTTAFNSGTGVNGLKIGISPASFHFEGDTPYSFQNEVGYTDNGDGSFTPHNGNNATLDANGNVLQFSGEAPCPAQAVNSPCINLNGTTQYAQTNIPSNLPALSGDRSFASRFVVDGFSVATGLANRIVTQSQTNSSRFVFAVDNGNLAASAAGVGVVRGSTTLIVGETYTGFVAYDYDAGELRLYLNGVLDGVQTGVSAPEDTDAEPMRIGSQNNTLARFFHGDLYDVEMFSYAATAEQVLQWHNGELHGDVAIFPFSEGAGSVCSDVVGDFTCSLMGNASNTWATQDDFHASLALGFDRVGTFDGTAYVEFPSVTSLASKTVKLTFQYTEGEQQIFQISTGSRYLAATLNSTRGGSADFVVGTGAHPLSDIKYLTKTGGFTSGGLYELEAVLDGNSRLIAAFIDGVALVDSDADTRVQTTAVAQHRLGIRLAGGFEYAGALCNYSISDFGTFAMAENSGTNVPDTSGNGNDGTLVGDDGSNFWAVHIPANLDGTSRVRAELSNPAAYDSDGVWQSAIGQDFINIEGFDGVYTGGDGFDGITNFSKITPNGEGRILNVTPAPTGEDLTNIQKFVGTFVDPDNLPLYEGLKVEIQNASSEMRISGLVVHDAFGNNIMPTSQAVGSLTAGFSDIVAGEVIHTEISGQGLRSMTVTTLNEIRSSPSVGGHTVFIKFDKPSTSPSRIYIAMQNNFAFWENIAFTLLDEDGVESVLEPTSIPTSFDDISNNNNIDALTTYVNVGFADREVFALPSMPSNTGFLDSAVEGVCGEYDTTVLSSFDPDIDVTQLHNLTASPAIGESTPLFNGVDATNRLIHTGVKGTTSSELAMVNTNELCFIKELDKALVLSNFGRTDIDYVPFLVITGRWTDDGVQKYLFGSSDSGTYGPRVFLGTSQNVHYQHRLTSSNQITLIPGTISQIVPDQVDFCMVISADVRGQTIKVQVNGDSFATGTGTQAFGDNILGSHQETCDGNGFSHIGSEGGLFGVMSNFDAVAGFDTFSNGPNADSWTAGDAFRSFAFGATDGAMTDEQLTSIMNYYRARHGKSYT